MGFADLGYEYVIKENGVADFYLLLIAKLLNDQYGRLLNFHFHTLIKQRHNIELTARTNTFDLIPSIFMPWVSLSAHDIEARAISF